MILSIEDNDIDQEKDFNRSESTTSSSDKTYSFDESDV
jgi:hypothetical protein